MVANKRARATCAWCGRWHDVVRVFGDDACDLSLAWARLVVMFRRPAFRLLTRITEKWSPPAMVANKRPKGDTRVVSVTPSNYHRITHMRSAA